MADLKAMFHTRRVHVARQIPAKKAAGKKAVPAKTTLATKAPRTAKAASSATVGATATQAKYPRHDIERALRIPRAILDQNAGHPASPAETAKLLGGKVTGAFNVEVSSSKKYGFLESSAGKLSVSDRAKRALRPQSDSDELGALREAVLAAADISEVYSHYRGEFLPDDKFFNNALVETFAVPADKTAEFREIFLDSLRSAKLLEESSGRIRIIDVGRDESHRDSSASAPQRRSAAPSVEGTCFVMQPFGPPLGGYYDSIFKPAIEQTGLRPVRADADMFGAGKIMDQVWRGIRGARVLVAELTSRNPNVFYELGLAHALGKPVVLVSSNEQDVPFDLNHIRVIYYDTSDPFWGQKLIDKVADNVRSALANPEEAVFTVDDV